MKKKISQIAFCLLVMSNSLFAQWLGSTNSTGNVYRDGNVGIGTTNPQAKIDVNGLFHLNRPPQLIDNLSALGIPNGSYLGIAPTNLSSTNNSYMLLTFPTNNSFRIATNYDGHLPNGYFRNVEFGRIMGDPYMIIKDGGSVGIGTTNTGSMKLAVEGKIGAREVQVTLTNPFPDYVFGSSYKLRDLFSLEKYINQHKHLPGIPSAAEVEKNGGIELGEMNRKLLEKVEELTLYVIELKKENETMKATMSELSNSRK